MILKNLLLYYSVAQLVERMTVNHKAIGSNPIGVFILQTINIILKIHLTDILAQKFGRLKQR